MSNPITQQQWTDKMEAMKVAAAFANGIFGAAGPQPQAAAADGSAPAMTAQEVYDTMHARCYQYLIFRAMPDETVYTSPSARSDAAVSPPALLGTLQKQLADPVQGAALLSALTKLIATFVPGVGPAIAGASALAAGVQAIPVAKPPASV